MFVIKILAIIFLAAGFGIVFASKFIVNRFELDKKAKCSFEHEMNEEELQEYKLTKASVNVKMAGLLVALPWIVLVVVAFR